jgi:uncharacterized protein (TIGR03790 family)
VLLVVNDRSALSKDIAAYYTAKRGIPATNVCHIKAAIEEEVDWIDYEDTIESPIAKCLRKGKLVEQVLYIATTAGIPLRVSGSPGLEGDVAAVDSELALLYTDLKKGKHHPEKGWLPNPFFGKRDAKFSHPEFPIYLVTRLAAYDLAGVKAMIDRSLQARNRGKFVLDQDFPEDKPGNDWLRNAVIRLAADRVVFDDTAKVLYKQTEVIGLASWGSNDKNRHERFVGFQWLPGAIATEYVSSNGRTFVRPPKEWNISDWASPAKYFAGSPQSLTADYLEEGASAATGHVAEPYLTACPRPDLLLPAYASGRNLAESFYLSIPYLSWQNIVAGDPLMSLGPPVK